MASPSRALLDLVTLHGTDELRVGQTFASGKSATYFMQDYAFNRNTRCIIKSSGKMKIYTCDDKKNREKSGDAGDFCKWEIRVSIRTNRDKSKHLWVSKVDNHHYDFCTSIGVATERQLTQLRTFRAGVLASRTIKGKELVALVQAGDGVNLQASKSKLHCAKDKVVAVTDGQWRESFRRLPFILADLKDANVGTSVHVEVDQHQRFLRGFVALGANVSAQTGLLPLLGFDGAHCKHSKYNGVVLSLLGRDGNNQNVTLATALVNVESEPNIRWFLDKCLDAGIDLGDRAVFCDRGKMVGAAERFHLQTGIKVNLRYCTVHLIRNMNKKFKLTGQEFENLVWAVQAADTHDKYAKALLKMAKNYGDAVVKYIKEIGPAVWTVHANTSSFVADVRDPDAAQDVAVDATNCDFVEGSVSTTTSSRLCDGCHEIDSSSSALTDIDNSEEVGDDFDDIECECSHPEVKNALPLFKWRSSNFVESDNNAMIASGVRTSDPCSAFYKLAVAEMKKMNRRHKDIQAWQKEKRSLTPYVNTLWLEEKGRVGEYHVERSNEFISYVSHPGDSTHSREVNISALTCTCPTFDQMRMACRHMFAALRERGLQSRAQNAFHPAYLVSVYTSTFHEKSIALPVRDAPAPIQVVKPSPFYKQAGRRVTRRMASAGETGNKSTYVCKTCRDTGHNRRICRRHANEADEANPDLVASVFQIPRIAHSDLNITLSDEASRMSIDFLLG